jgi:hypothetical protein
MNSSWRPADSHFQRTANPIRSAVTATIIGIERGRGLRIKDRSCRAMIGSVATMPEIYRRTQSQ